MSEEVVEGHGGIDRKHRSVHAGGDDLPGKLEPFLPGRAKEVDVRSLFRILTKSGAPVVVPPAQSPSPSVNSGSKVRISIVFPAPKAPDTTIFGFSSAIR